MPVPLGEEILKDVLWDRARQQSLPTDRSKEMSGDTNAMKVESTDWHPGLEKIKSGYDQNLKHCNCTTPGSC